VIIHRYLLDRKIVIPQRKVQTNTGSGIVGAYIKDPLVGMHGWIVSFDLTSLYPHLIISHNISPDTLKGRLASPFTVDQYVNGAANKVKSFLVDNNYSLAASNYYYDRSKQGFMADLMELFFQQRKQYKDLMLEAKKRFAKTKDPVDEAEMAKFDNYQKAAKVKLNSAYGAFGNAYFRWYDKRLAESITMSGQLTIRWAEQKMNALISITLLQQTPIRYMSIWIDWSNTLTGKNLTTIKLPAILISTVNRSSNRFSIRSTTSSERI
jgi:DNA polymerase elongation subunit (family B)